MKDGTFGETIRKGISQVDAWEIWLDKSFSHLKNVFNTRRNKNRKLPEEFSEYDRTRIHYVVIAGRRTHFTESTQRLIRKNLEERKLNILHYDNLLECSLEVLESKSY